MPTRHPSAQLPGESREGTQGGQSGTFSPQQDPSSHTHTHAPGTPSHQPSRERAAVTAPHTGGCLGAWGWCSRSALWPEPSSRKQCQPAIPHNPPPQLAEATSASPAPTQRLLATRPGAPLAEPLHLPTYILHARPLRASPRKHTRPLTVPTNDRTG